MATLDLSYRSAIDLARMIRTGQISPVEAVRHSLDRIAAINPKLNAFCFIYEEEALTNAKEAERAIRENRPVGPLHGVPIALKDFTAYPDAMRFAGADPGVKYCKMLAIQGIEAINAHYAAVVAEIQAALRADQGRVDPYLAQFRNRVKQ